jgi:hypothetical protein
MHRPPSLLARLRRHRGWWVLAAAVMLIKLTGGTICLTDGARTRLGQAATTIGALASMDAAKASATDAVGCPFGETGECHCACAHTATMPSTAMLSVEKIQTGSHAAARAPGFAPAMTGSLIRPPIA